MIKLLDNNKLTDQRNGEKLKYEIFNKKTTKEKVLKLS